jgi:hypothetical protein
LEGLSPESLVNRICSAVNAVLQTLTFILKRLVGNDPAGWGSISLSIWNNLFNCQLRLERIFRSHCCLQIMNALHHSIAMNLLILRERGEKWSLRLPGEVFPVLEASPSTVVDYIKKNFTEKRLVELHRETGIVERLQVAALKSA